ncbi:MAG: hypothetical protein PUD25_06870 [Bacilli bacterium]|mgnify:FL=1|nr:hypothetical protein [Bacilli bacterium]
MDSRSDRYYTENNIDSIPSTRSSRNKKLYKEVYGKYNDLDNLPLEDNTDEIDMAKLKELVLSEGKQNDNPIKENLNIIEQRKRNIDEQKVYDINKILEKAKYENDKLKETTQSIPKVNKQILNTLQSTELSLEELKKASKSYQDYQNNENIVDLNHEEEQTSQSQSDSLENDLSMTRELKYQNLAQEENQEEPQEDLSLDLFSDLKPTGNTIITKPIHEEEVTSHQKETPAITFEKDNSDIDIIKPSVAPVNDDFFTSSYEFSKKDFMQVDDDFSELNQKSSILKIILLFLMIFIVGGVITYFVITYGIGVS